MPSYQYLGSQYYVIYALYNSQFFVFEICDREIKNLFIQKLPPFDNIIFQTLYFSNLPIYLFIINININMSSLKQRLAEKIKRAAGEKKRQLEQYANQEEDFNMPAQEEEQFKNKNSQLKRSHDQQKSQNGRIQSQPDEEQQLDISSFRQQQVKKNPFLIQKQAIQESDEEIQKQIEVMVRQKQSRRKEDDQQKKKQMILNALKNKRKPRPPKPMDKPTPFNQLSPPYQEIKIFASYLPIYEERRRRQLYSTIVDLGVKNLQQVILQCFQEGLITKSFMKSIRERGVERQIDFVRKFASNRLNEYDFQATKFTPLDHRGLCGLLLKRDRKYILGERIYCVFKEITDFYEVIYAMEEYEYQKLCEAVRIKYKLTWRESAFKNYEPLDEEVLNKFETGSIFQLRPSPMFGADLNDDQKQFFKAKKQKYPDKVGFYKEKSSKTPSKQYSEEKQFSDSESYSDSYEHSSIEEGAAGESGMVSSSAFKSSTLRSSLRKRKKGMLSESQSMSSSDIKNSSEIISQLSNESDQFAQFVDDFDSEQISESDSMFKSKSKSVSKNVSRQKRSKKQTGKSKSKGNGKKKTRSRKSSESGRSSEEFQDHNIFQQLEN